MKKFKAGQKVKLPTSKNAGWGTLESSVVRDAKYKGQDYLYVTGYEDGYTVVLSPSYEEGYVEGDFFLESEVEAYRKFENGAMVKMPIQKTAGVTTIEDVHAYYSGKQFLYVKGYDSELKEYMVGGTTEDGEWTYCFKEEDLEPYVVPSPAPRKFKVGDKVKIPTFKLGEYLYDSAEVTKAKERGNDFLYIVGHRFKDVYSVNAYDGEDTGDWFREDELEPYVPHKFKVGDKVKIPKQKTGGAVKLKDSSVVAQAKAIGQDYLTVRYVFKDGQIELVPNERSTQSVGELFNPEDLEPYIEHKYKAGDKVKIPKTKSAGETSVENSVVIKRARKKGQDFLYFMGYEDGIDKVSLNEELDGYGDYFRLGDLEPYEPTPSEKRRERIKELMREISDLMEEELSHE